MTTYIQRLHQAVRAKKNGVVVGLDPRFDDLPPVCEGSIWTGWMIRRRARVPLKSFASGLSTSLLPLVPAVKPQAAFFEELGPEERLCWGGDSSSEKIGLLVICDAKREISGRRRRHMRGLSSGKRSGRGSVGGGCADGESVYGEGYVVAVCGCGGAARGRNLRSGADEQSGGGDVSGSSDRGWEEDLSARG